MKEQYPSRVHQICDNVKGDTYHKPFLSVFEYDSEQQVFKDLDLSKSIMVERGEIRSLIKYSDDSFMICGLSNYYDDSLKAWQGHYIAMIFDVVTMLKIKSFAINTLDTEGVYRPLVSTHMVPDTGNCFMLEFHETQSIYIREIKTGKR